MYLIHLEPNGETNTAEYVHNIISHLPSGYVKKVATSTNSIHSKNQLGVFGEYGSTNSKFKKAFYYLIGWIKLLLHAASRDNNVILHYHWLKLSPIDYFFLYISQLRSNIQVIGTVHNFLPHESNRLDQFFFPKIYRLSDRLITHTKSTKEKLEAINIATNKCEIIPHYSYDVQQVSGDGEFKKNSLLFFGVIREYKGLEILIEALQIIGTDKNWSLSVIGKQEMDLNRILQKINSYGFKDRITVNTGWVEEEKIPEIFQSHEIVILPYTSIDNSGLLHLAMSYGKKIIASRLGSLNDIIVEGNTGLLCEPNDPKDLASKIQLLLSDSSKFSSMGKNANIYMKEHHSIDAIAKSHDKVYRELKR